MHKWKKSRVEELKVGRDWPKNSRNPWSKRKRFSPPYSASHPPGVLLGWGGCGRSLELSISLIERGAFVSVSNKACWWNERCVLLVLEIYPHI